MCNFWYNFKTPVNHLPFVSCSQYSCFSMSECRTLFWL